MRPVCRSPGDYDSVFGDLSLDKIRREQDLPAMSGKAVWRLAKSSGSPSAWTSSCPGTRYT